MFFASCGKRGHEEGDGQGKKRYLKPAQFSVIKCKEKDLFLSYSLQVL